jgi:nucleoside-diphosphate-sugar epimerase
MAMRVLLTGHEGYLGTVMAPALVGAGHDVVGLDTGYFRECVLGPRPDLIAASDIDLRDVSAEHLRGIDAVVHLAALSNDAVGDLEPSITYETNIDAALLLARLARDAGASRFLFASSCSIYGASGEDDLVAEDAPMRPLTPYAESKVRVEDGLHELADAGFSPIYLRNATAYGWSPRLRLDLVVNDLVASGLLTGEVRMLSDGTPWRPVVHVQDVAGAFAAALDAPRGTVHDRAFNVGFSGENHQIRDLAEIVMEAVGGCEVTVTGETGSDPRSYRVDFSRLEAALPQLEQRWDARRGAAELARKLRDHGLTRSDRPHFTRLHRLSELRARRALSPSLRWAAGQRLATASPT